MAKGNNKAMRWKRLQSRMHEIIYEADTTAGKVFDILLLVFIVTSIIVVMLDSVAEYNQRYGDILYKMEWGFTILFSIEYVLRLLSIRQPIKYVFSFLGLIDLLSIIPTYISLFIAGTQSLIVLRGLRLLRVFRILRLRHYVSEMQYLSSAVINSLRKISIFLLFVITCVIIMGSVMYLVEDAEDGFTSIPQCIYWAIVTITTVGYGDISPATPVGKFISCLIMLLGYGIIAVPTGIVTTEMALVARNKKEKNDVCPNCGKEGHDDDAVYCKRCGSHL